ncbi:TPA: M23 family metallopeptidase [Xanthomonas vasicola pv. zeae]|uniref:M23 family peptidase n=1 Tax=Xanthomonas vasicola pv. vasculorum TaxID=325776 RepID=A0AAE8F3U4_XANVA|nr:M23 family metallopeptidase [Xanthomonas vasicola]AVQ07711.1 M23 family peptidase [Xanthomonas vasicola pv. vasculorum]AZM71909.1 M23 family peptidase [Xanthomonas vasicola pv. vasculorum]AZR26661.1 M23 family metallopeptidase [Xanthomonas vasicola pv. arecae]AZR35579.1 M23 family metallopeptidase [Xanthomonas vasicola]KFA33718.1 peptidase [Xanthomonas vasicola pv. vasculorum NCPPB 206]
MLVRHLQVPVTGPSNTPPSSPRPATGSPARRLRSVVVTVALLCSLAVAARWAWQLPIANQLRTSWELSQMPPPAQLHLPVKGVRARQIADTFGAPRGRDRTHAGVDIFAPRGTPVVAATRGVVSAIRDQGLGGKQVWLLGPAMERHYYAHLDDWAAGLSVGDVVKPGTPLGIVGTTGNARGTPPHLHYGVYGRNGAYDPLPLLRKPAPHPAN